MIKYLSAALVAVMLTSPALADGDVAAGEKVFKKCAVCHTIDGSTKKKAGPTLDGIFGRAAATVEGYKYSKKMKDRKSVV